MLTVPHNPCIVFSNNTAASNKVHQWTALNPYVIKYKVQEIVDARYSTYVARLCSFKISHCFELAQDENSKWTTV